MDTQHEKMMRAALDAARAGFAAGEAPIGCALVLESGKIVASGHNEMRSSRNLTLHAEIVAFAAAAGKLKPGATGTLMVSTLEPCVMCTGAAMENGIATILYGLQAPADSGTRRVRPPESPGATSPVIIGNILAAESRALFVEWMAAYRDDPSREDQRKFIEQLLALTS
jgi:tRNA(adenine34) deaminase